MAPENKPCDCRWLRLDCSTWCCNNLAQIDRRSTDRVEESCSSDCEFYLAEPKIKTFEDAEKAIEGLIAGLQILLKKAEERGNKEQMAVTWANIQAYKYSLEIIRELKASVRERIAELYREEKFDFIIGVEELRKVLEGEK